MTDKNKENKTILVMGSTSFVGIPVVKKLLEKGYKIKCFVRTGSNLSQIKELPQFNGNKIIISTGNLQSEDSILHNLKEIDELIYLVDLENTYFIENLLRAAAKTKLKRAIFLSSTTVLVPINSKFKESKIRSENLVRNSKLDFTILRSSMIYGSVNDRNFSKMIDFIWKKDFFVVFGKGNNLIQPIYVEDVADSVVNAVGNENTVKKVYEIAGKEPLKYREMIMIMRKKMNKNFRIISFPLKLSKFLISIYSHIFKNTSLTTGMIERMEIHKAYDYSAAVRDFGFNPISFEEGIGKLIDKLKNQRAQPYKTD